MLARSIPDILSELNTTPSEIEKYRSHYTGLLETIFTYAFVPAKKFLLPEGTPPYNQDFSPSGTSPTNFANEIRRLYIFSPDRELQRVRREQLFIQLLETIHVDEIALLIAIKDQTVDVLYPMITLDQVLEWGFLKQFTLKYFSEKEAPEMPTLVITPNESVQAVDELLITTFSELKEELAIDPIIDSTPEPVAPKKRGRPKKEVDPNAPVKVPGKRGRPKKVVPVG